MNFSYPFIRRPVGTILLATGLFLVGAVAYRFLPVASVPAVDIPTIAVSASRPGASPETMAATVAAPLERRLGAISGVTEITSVSSIGQTRIIIQFDLSRDVDGAARDVQAALNSALADLPLDLPSLPSFRKFNPAATPILILALTSKSISPSAIYDAADTIVAQRIMQVAGVADVAVSGAEQPAIRVRINPVALANMGVSFDDVRLAISRTNAQGPLGTFDGAVRAESIATNDQLRNPTDYHTVVVKSVNGNVIRLSDVATITQGTRNTNSAAWYNAQPAVLLIITKQMDANVIETVDRIHGLIPELKRWIPSGIDVDVLSDRTQTIRASVADMQLTLAGSVAMVMLVVFIFLRRTAPTVAAGVTIPLSLAGTCALMWLVGFSIDNLSLMALAVSVGFVVDDAIVMIENTFRNLERGRSPLRAAIEGARQIGFTVIAISISLIAAFIPLLFMGGIAGRLFREFSVTLAFAIAISTVVSLSVTPMICAHYIREAPTKRSRFDRLVEGSLDHIVRAYGASLRLALNHRAVMLMIMLATVALTVDLYVRTPKGFFPQDDTGLIFGGTRAPTDVSFKTMVELQRQVVDIVKSDPAVFGVGSSVGGNAWSGSVNRGTLFISLKPLAERDGLSTQRVIERLRRRITALPGIQLFMFPAQDLRVGGRQSQSQYQFTLWSPDLDELTKWVPRVQERIRQVPGVTDVSTDREQGGLQLAVAIDRERASALGVKMQAIDSALNNAFAQRQISTIYTQRNQYRVILEIDPQYQRDPSDLAHIYVPGFGGTSVPLSTVARFEKGLAPLVVNHQGQYPAVTISFGLRPDVQLETATEQIMQAVRELHMPDSIQADFAGEARQLAQTAAAGIVLIITALLAVYIVLGILYESLAHPLTIISTLPSAGLGALLALQLFGTELSLIAFIGIILLIGIVKKNGIMLVDFALEGERQRGLTPEQAIYEACIARFRPILMTTLAALLGAVPLVIATGPGSELRRPLGITIIGGLVVSQVLTLYTTPVIYLLLDRLHHRLWGRRSARPGWRARLAEP
ncbi:MAG TPA: efflux RND transporter permease subunit [Xanthobacteraceae bacterium]|nr:efflux RND transporter permease subunit [Xanthobacteraceae bacterium]